MSISDPVFHLQQPIEPFSWPSFLALSSPLRFTLRQQTLHQSPPNLYHKIKVTATYKGALL